MLCPSCVCYKNEPRRKNRMQNEIAKQHSNITQEIIFIYLTFCHLLYECRHCYNALVDHSNNHAIISRIFLNGSRKSEVLNHYVRETQASFKGCPLYGKQLLYSAYQGTLINYNNNEIYKYHICIHYLVGIKQTIFVFRMYMLARSNKNPRCSPHIQ